MGISDRHFEHRLSYAGRANPLIVLIAIAMIFFVSLAFFKALIYLSMPYGTDITEKFDNNVLSWLALPNEWSKAITRPWTLLTYGFTHTNFWTLLGSLIWLWCFGYILVDLTGFKKIAPVFLYGALAGGLVFLLMSGLSSGKVAGLEYMIGGSAGVLAICTAATTISPKYKVFPMLRGGISLWILSVVYLVIDMATLPPNFPVLHISHLGGILAGFLFIFFLRNGADGSDWMNNLYDWFFNLFNPEKKQQTRNRIKSTLFYKATEDPFSKTPKLTQQKLDEILDKINQHGFDRLSADEKDFLERASKEDMKGK
ncbi:MAG TPA: rhomboid family intramembrane serine protease [Niabella sp.]|nr:rhomboid family intramembrane serine protease [Niabella sp.]